MADFPPPVVVTGPGNGPATFAQEDFNLFTASMMTGPVDIFGGPTTLVSRWPSTRCLWWIRIWTRPRWPVGPGGLDLHPSSF